MEALRAEILEQRNHFANKNGLGSHQPGRGHAEAPKLFFDSLTIKNGFRQICDYRFANVHQLVVLKNKIFTG